MRNLLCQTHRGKSTGLHVFVLSALLTILAVAPKNSLAQDQATVRLYVSNTGLKANTDDLLITLTSEADLSPVPSEVLFFGESVERDWMLGLGFGVDPGPGYGSSWSSWELFAGTNLVITSANVSYILGGASYEYNNRAGNSAALGFGASVLGGYAWGTVGEVGTAEGDFYLDAPDGSRYDFGAEITAQGLRLGGDLFASLKFGRWLAISGGYRVSAGPSIWRYEVTDGSSASELPSEGFLADPPDYDFSGPFIKVSTTILGGGDWASPRRRKISEPGPDSTGDEGDTGPKIEPPRPPVDPPVTVEDPEGPAETFDERSGRLHVTDFDHGSAFEGWQRVTEGNTRWTRSIVYSRSGDYSFKVGPSSCERSCTGSNEHSVSLQFEVGGELVRRVSFWAMEAAASQPGPFSDTVASGAVEGGTGWVEVDGLELPGSEFDPQEVGKLGQWIPFTVEINQPIHTLTIKLSDIRSGSAFYLDDVVVTYE